MTDDKRKTVQYYLSDLGTLLLEAARQAKQARDSAKNAEREFESGRLMAYNEIISLMQQQAEAFDIDLSNIGLAGVDPDKEFV